MAIKVIKAGKRKATARATCPICHSILEYTIEDVRVTEQYQETSNWICCPICSNSIDVDPIKDFTWIDPVGYYTDN